MSEGRTVPKTRWAPAPGTVLGAGRVSLQRKTWSRHPGQPATVTSQDSQAPAPAPPTLGGSLRPSCSAVSSVGCRPPGRGRLGSPMGCLLQERVNATMSCTRQAPLRPCA